MEKHRKYLVIAIVLVILLMLIFALVAGLTWTPGESSEGSTTDRDTNLHLPVKLDPSKCPSDYGPRPVLLVSLDGFRADYLQRNLTPTIQLLADKGVHTDYMIPSFPTITFPNHYTIVTGLYPETHGIIANNFYDPVFNQRFTRRGDRKNEGKWWGGEPIWNTLTRQEKRSATFFWPGSEADINGKRPDYWKPYNGDITFEERVLQVLDWLALPSGSRPSWVSLYFDEPDHAGHGNGPSSKEVNEQLQRVDKTMKSLMKGLQDRNLIHCVNVIILADHGLVKAGKEKIIDLMDYLPNLKKEAYYEKGIMGMINPKNKTEEVELEMMESLVGKREEMRVYSREGLPKRLHFAKNRRISDIIIELDPGFTVQFNSTWALEGQHGYDNYFSTMNALFLAYGPDFKQGLKIEPFQNIELYNLMCHLTDVKPAENNGTWGSLHHLLADPPAPPTLPKVTQPPVLRFPSGDLEPHWNTSGCDMDEFTLQPWMSSLNQTEMEEKTIETSEAPWGIPQASDPSKNFSLLYHSDHVTGFSAAFKMPLWTSFTVKPEQTNLAWIKPSMDQWTSDVRLPKETSPLCETFKDFEQFDYSMFTLFPATTEVENSGDKSASYLVTNAIPVHAYFNDNWRDLRTSLLEWMKSVGPMNVLLGPVFDSNDDNPHLNDLQDRSENDLPSDLFAVLTRCQETVTSLHNCPLDHLDTRSFILHQYQPVDNDFKSVEDYLTKFSATVRDVERATGLTLFPNLSFEHRVNLTLKIHQNIWSLS